MHDPVRFGYIGGGGIARHVHLPNFAAGECRFRALAGRIRRFGGKD